MAGAPIIVVMDGACALCSRAARMLAAADVDDRFRIAVVQSPLGRKLQIEDGRALTGAQASLARNRIAGFGRADLCALPDPGVRRRLIGMNEEA